MAKSKEYDNEIKILQKEMTEYDKVEHRIQTHLDCDRVNVALINVHNGS